MKPNLSEKIGAKQKGGAFLTISLESLLGRRPEGGEHEEKKEKISTEEENNQLYPPEKKGDQFRGGGKFLLLPSS